MADVMQNLSRDIGAADNKGLSYGKYIAWKYENGYSPQPRKEPEPEPEPNGECLRCKGKFYNPTKRKKLFCCSKCCHAYYNEKARKKREAMQQNVSETVAGCHKNI